MPAKRSASSVRMASDILRDMPFPLQCVHCRRHPDNLPHGHPFYELVLVTGGTGVHVVEEREYPLAAGDVFLLYGGMTHHYIRTRELTLFNILFDPARLQLPLSELRQMPGYHMLFWLEPRLRGTDRSCGRLQLRMRSLAQATAIVGRLREELDGTPDGYRFMACNALMELLGFLCRSCTESRQPALRPLLPLGAVLAHIEQHFGEPISIRQLCDVAHMSESSLTRFFRMAVGFAPIEYVIRVRAGHAAARLRTTDDRITDVALACGFSDGNYFSRQFRRLHGKSPRAYRQAHRAISGESGIHS